MCASTNDSITVLSTLQEFAQVAKFRTPSAAGIRWLAPHKDDKDIAGIDTEGKLHIWKVDRDLGKLSIEHVASKTLAFDASKVCNNHIV